MPTISSYALQLSTVNFTAISTSTFDLFITEGAPLAPGGGFPAITDTQVAQLRGQGRTVVGYVNVAVTDDARYYWNSSWTSNGHDTGTPIQGQAPSWLDQAVPLDFDLDNHQDALIVEYWDPAWQQIVIDQAVALVQRGYSGVYLDNVATYFAGEPLLILQSVTPAPLTYDQAWSRGILYTAPNTGYNSLGTFAYPATAGADNLAGGDGPNQISGLGGNDYLNGGAGADTLSGNGGDDIFIVDNAGDVTVEASGQGRDVVYASVNYSLAAGSHIEVLSTISQAAATAMTLIGNELVNEIYGNAGANFIDGGGGADYLAAFGGDDIYIVDAAGDVVAEAASEGRDVVYAKASWALGAGSSVEVLSTISSGATTAINLTGNALDNELYGNAGANTLNGGAGADYLMGYGGSDNFAFTTALGGGNIDQIADFNAAADTILLDDAVFAALPAGALNANAFVVGTTAQDSTDRIVYDSATGNLYYDADGSGAGAAVLFATLVGHPTITASDFTVI